MPDFEAGEFFDFPCGLASIVIPHQWRVLDRSFNEARFEPPEGGEVTVKVIAHEQTEAIVRGAYEEFVGDVISREQFERMRPTLQQWWDQEEDEYGLAVVGYEEADDGTRLRIHFRNLDVRRPDIVRKVDWYYDPPAGADAEFLVGFEETLRRLTMETRFAPEETELDRVAPSTSLKAIWVGDGIVMRVPFDWTLERENEDGTGRYVIEEPDGRDRWTLWLDWEEFSTGEDDPAEAAVGLRETLLGREGTTAVPDADGQLMALHAYADDDGDEPLRFFTWHRAVPREDSLMLAHFSLVVSADAADLPEIRQVRELVGREAGRAILVPSAWTSRRDDE